MSNNPQQPTIKTCPECGGQRVGARIYEGGLGRGQVGVHWVTGLNAQVCTRCGHTTLYAEDLPKLLKELQKHPGDFTY